MMCGICLYRSYAYCDRKYSNLQCTCKNIYTFPTTTPSSRNNHNVSYVKRHSRHILSVAISMLCSIRRSTITRDQGRTGAVINCIKLHLDCERKSEAKYIVTIDCVNKSLNNADNVLRSLIDLILEAINNFIFSFIVFI